MQGAYFISVKVCSLQDLYFTPEVEIIDEQVRIFGLKDY